MNQNKDKVRSTLYIVAGAYLAYLAYSLFQGMETSTISHALQITFIIVFAVGGILLAIVGLVSFQKAGMASEDGEGIYNDEQEVIDVETTDQEAKEADPNSADQTEDEEK